MPKFVQCLGYKGHKCQKTIKQVTGVRLRCKSCVKKHSKLYMKSYRESRDYDRRRYAENSESASVRAHHRWIFKSKDHRRRNYKGMLFFDEWNPDKGGSIRAGGDWITVNLRKRPRGCSLHIIHHDIGFMPGNLEWTHPRKQINQQIFRIIAQQRHEIKNLKRQLIEAQQIIALVA